VTGLTQLDLLRASHIKPWAKCSNRERLDPNNGLLLAPHVDLLFELGYITFTGNGRLIVSKRLDPAVARAWRLKADQSVGAFSKAQKSYLTYHRRLRFKR
jgi:predicted restriction endonuclease